MTEVYDADLAEVTKKKNLIRRFFGSLLGIFGWYFKYSLDQVLETRKVLAKIMLTITYLVFIPAGFGIVAAAGAIAIDQATYPKNKINPIFTSPAISEMTIEQKGDVLIRAAIYALEQELDSPLGWAPNDICCLQFFDNRLKRQAGIIGGTREVTQLMFPLVSRFGLGDEEDRDLIKARQKGFAFDESNWGWYSFTNSEKYYYQGIEDTSAYLDRLKRGNANANITTADIYAILNVVKDRVLGIPYGLLTQRNRSVEWTELDDHVYIAQGYAIVARNVIAVLALMAKDEIEDAGSTENIAAAIDSLDAAIAMNPWWIARGDAGSMIADHRSKMSRYYTEAIRRIEDTAQSIRR